MTILTRLRAGVPFFVRAGKKLAATALEAVVELHAPPRLLGDALEGNLARFARQGGVEHGWRVIQPLLDHPGPVHGYERGSCGPAEAGGVTAGHGGWHDPAPSRA